MYDPVIQSMIQLFKLLKGHRGPVAQLVEHRAVTREVASSTQGLK